MSKAITGTLKILVSIGVACLLLYLVFRNIDWSDFFEKAKSVDYSWVIVSIVLSVVAYVARAYRWNIIFEPLGYRLKTSRTLLAVIIGYLANLALPRLGEITRCGVLKRSDDVPIPVALGSVVSERLVDLLTLVFLFFVSLLWEFDRIVDFFSAAYSNVQIPVLLYYVLGLGAIVGILIVIWVVKNREKISGKFGELLTAFIQGLLALKNISNLKGFLISTVILWLVYYLMSYLIIFSLPETNHLGIGAGFMLLVTGGIAISIPVQSGFGTYHGMIAGMLLLYGVDKTTGIFLATLLHTSQIVAVAIFGAIAIIISFLLNKRKAK